jgi:hypothetical protein
MNDQFLQWLTTHQYGKDEWYRQQSWDMLGDASSGVCKIYEQSTINGILQERFKKFYCPIKWRLMAVFQEA